LAEEAQVTEFHLDALVCLSIFEFTTGRRRGFGSDEVSDRGCNREGLVFAANVNVTVWQAVEVHAIAVCEGVGQVATGPICGFARRRAMFETEEGEETASQGTL
jgi:hypothetical protein